MLHLRRSNEQYYSNSPDIFREVFIHRTLVTVALFMRLDDLVWGDHAVIPVVYRLRVVDISNKLHAPPTGWDNDLWDLADWDRDA
jgi:hypothetical protein